MRLALCKGVPVHQKYIILGPIELWPGCQGQDHGQHYQQGDGQDDIRWLLENCLHHPPLTKKGWLLPLSGLTESVKPWVNAFIGLAEGKGRFVLTVIVYRDQEAVIIRLTTLWRPVRGGLNIDNDVRICFRLSINGFSLNLADKIFTQLEAKLEDLSLNGFYQFIFIPPRLPPNLLRLENPRSENVLL